MMARPTTTIPGISSKDQSSRLKGTETQEFEMESEHDDVVVFEHQTDKKIKMMKEKGEEGWELVSVVLDATKKKRTFYFKRPKQ